MHRAKKPLVTDLNQHLICKLCTGYFVDATTIIECLHTFCRSCIVKYLQTNRYCPICDVQIHKTKPLLNIRPDKTLQDLVYKLVPRLFQNEIQRRRDFTTSHPECRPSFPDPSSSFIDTYYQHIVVPDESISLSLSYYGCKETTRYFRCPAAVSIEHLQKLIRAKYGLLDNHRVDILYNQDCLNSSLTLMDVAYIYSWKRKSPFELSYRIYEYTLKEKPKIETKVELVQNNNNNNWKEVQLRISENGEMSITGIQGDDDNAATADNNVDKTNSLELVNNNNYKAAEIVNKKELPELKLIAKNNVSMTTSTTTSAPSITTTSGATLLSSATTKTVFSTINSIKCSVTSSATTTSTSTPMDVRDNNSSMDFKTNENQDKTNKNHKTDLLKGVKRKADLTATIDQPVVKQQKQTILNHSIGLHNLSNNHPLKKHSQLNSKPDADNGDSFTKPTTPSTGKLSQGLSRPGTPKPITSKPCYMPKPIINIPKPSTSSNKLLSTTTTTATPIVTTTITTTSGIKSTTSTTMTQPVMSVANQTSGKMLNIKSKATTPIGYKTLRDPPKSWNSQIAKANINKPIVTDPKYNNELKNVRPAKFFKMRNNMPRYLGNPASGVKPMYQVHPVSPEKEKDGAVAVGGGKGEIKKHSIVKIDPKTLKPISEKAPETTSLMNNSDLKINTSSVSIFNPLKLQNSPKSERKSPKSPHSPKSKTAVTTTTTSATSSSSSPSSKRDKLSLNFTPPNPFIPNLTSPTMNPNQFLYPTGPSGFPPYDPRVMAAYHSLFYGPRMAFPSGLSLDLNHQRKNFEMTPPPTSPKISQQHSPQVKSSGGSDNQQSSSSPSSSRGNFKSTPVKKTGKDWSNKSEKSLQNAVEKLTQNRVKEAATNNKSVVGNNNSSTSGEKKNVVEVDNNAAKDGVGGNKVDEVSSPAPPQGAAVAAVSNDVIVEKLADSKADKKPLKENKEVVDVAVLEKSSTSSAEPKPPESESVKKSESA